MNVTNYKRLYTLAFQNVTVVCVNGSAELTGFSYEKVYGEFAGTQKIGRNNEVTVLMRLTLRWSSTGINLIAKIRLYVDSLSRLVRPTLPDIV